MIDMVTHRPGASCERAFASKKTPNGSGSDFQGELLARTDEWKAAHTEENAGPEAFQRTTLTRGEIAGLAAKYGKNMSGEKYDAFLEELVDKGVLTNDEIMYLGYKGAVYTPPGVDSWCYRSDEYGNPLEDAYGNSLEWAKTMSLYIPKSLQTAGLFLHAQDHHKAFMTLADVLGRMDAQTRC